MKRICFLLLVVVALLSGCKKNTEIICNTPSELKLVLKENFTITANSEYPITYTTADELVATVSSDGVISCINVGETTITVSNSYENIYINVKVTLYQEPLLIFGCSPADVEAFQGQPDVIVGDSIYIYGGTNPGLSFSVWQMDYFFNNDKYYLSDLYIKNYMDFTLDRFLSEEYHFFDTLILTDTITSQEITYYLYLDADNVEDASFIVGKHYNANSFDDIRVFYQEIETDRSLIRK